MLQNMTFKAHKNDTRCKNQASYHDFQKANVQIAKSRSIMRFGPYFVI